MSEKPSRDRPLEPAEIAKLEAEAEQARAEARKANADASVSESQAHVSSILADRERDKRERELSALTHQRIYLFSKSVSAESVAACMGELAHWHRIDPGCRMEVVFNSPGGSVFAGMELFDYVQELRRADHYVVTSARGMAASMAGILLQAGDHRVIGREGYLLIHEVSSFAQGKVGEIEDEMALLKKMSERVIDIFASRSKLTKTKIRNGWRRKDWWLDSDECLRLGLVDEVR